MKLKRTAIDKFFKGGSTDVSRDQGQDDPEFTTDHLFMTSTQFRRAWQNLNEAC
jgi:hypothetical protein